MCVTNSAVDPLTWELVIIWELVGNRLYLLGCINGQGFFLFFQTVSGLPVMSITFWLDVWSIIKLFSFSSTFMEKFSRLVGEFCFYFPNKILWISLRFSFLGKKFLNAHYIKFRRYCTSVQTERSFLWPFLCRLRKHWSRKRNWEDLFCHVGMRSTSSAM